MIETPHPLHTLLHTYKVFLYLLLWVWFIRSNPNLILLGLAYHSHRGSLGFSLCNAVAMIAESNPLHTHIRSNYIYDVIQNPLLWLQVIGMQPQPDKLGFTVTVTVAVVGESLGYSLAICCRL